MSPSTTTMPPRITICERSNLEQTCGSELYAQRGCVGLENKVFYPDFGDLTKEARTKREEQITVAKAICATCPIQKACLRHAIENGEQYGVWGGLLFDGLGRRARKALREQY